MADIPTLEDIKRLLEAQKNEIVSAITEKLSQDNSIADTQWLRTYQVKKMLNVSDDTLFNYRIDGILRSKKLRGSHFYLKKEVLKMMSDGK